MLSASTCHPFKISLDFFNSCVCLSASSETRFKTTQNFKNAQFLFYFDSTNITILFVVVNDKFYMLKFVCIANVIVDACRRRIAAHFAFFVLFKFRKNAFSFVVFRTNEILSSTSSFRHRSYFYFKIIVKLFLTLQFFYQCLKPRVYFWIQKYEHSFVKKKIL